MVARGRKKTGRKPGKILTQTRTLARSTRAVADDGGITFGSGLVYAATHQFGLDEQRTSKVRAPGSVAIRFRLTIPARPFFPVREDGSTAYAEATPAGELFEEIEETIMDWLDPGRLQR